MLKKFILFSSMTVLLAGCGPDSTDTSSRSSGSSTNPPRGGAGESSDTGSSRGTNSSVVGTNSSQTGVNAPQGAESSRIPSGSGLGTTNGDTNFQSNSPGTP